jgi:GT2 family glycosyltransferase
LAKTLKSLAEQSAVPQEVIVVDASRCSFSETSEAGPAGQSFDRFVCVKADQVGAAAQRNQGVLRSAMPLIAFCDDDIDFHPDCLGKLWHALEADPGLGGVSAMITNQRYQPPGTVSRLLFTLLHGRSEKSFAGRVIGPAVNLLPEDREDLPDLVPVEWLNLGCTIYRREALPSPPFDSVFSGYSMMEDLTLSLRVGKKWRLANARTARIFHDSQPGTHKSDVSETAAMELVNRRYVMTKVLGRTGLLNHLQLIMWESFQLAVCAARAQSRPIFRAMWRGKWRAVRNLNDAAINKTCHSRISSGH